MSALVYKQSRRFSTRNGKSLTLGYRNQNYENLVLFSSWRKYSSIDITYFTDFKTFETSVWKRSSSDVYLLCIGMRHANLGK